MVRAKQATDSNLKAKKKKIENLLKQMIFLIISK